MQGQRVTTLGLWAMTGRGFAHGARAISKSGQI